MPISAPAYCRTKQCHLGQGGKQRRTVVRHDENMDTGHRMFPRQCAVQQHQNSNNFEQDTGWPLQNTTWTQYVYVLVRYILLALKTNHASQMPNSGSLPLSRLLTTRSLERPKYCKHSIRPPRDAYYYKAPRGELTLWNIKGHDTTDFGDTSPSKYPQKADGEHVGCNFF